MAPTGGHCMQVVAARFVVGGAARVPRVVSSGRRVGACELVRGGLVDGARIWAWGGAGLGRYYLVGQLVWFYLIYLGGGSSWVVERVSYVVLPARS